MANSFLRSTWKRIQGWFVANASQSTVVFLPDAGVESLPAYTGYVRLWLAEGFLAQQKAWAADQFPALHGGVSLSFLGNEPAAFASLSRPPEKWMVPGAQLDFPMTALLPFNGGTVEVEGALYKAATDSPIGTAIDVLGGIASLLGPPLAVAAVIADKLSDGLDAVLEASEVNPVLGVHWTLVSPGGGGNALTPGHLVVVGAPQGSLPGSLVIDDGRLRLDTARGRVPLTERDYLVLRVECRAERDDWRLPELDGLIRSAGEAFILGQQEVYQSRRTEAIARAWNCADLIPTDRTRVALLVKEELDSLAALGAVPGDERTIGSIAPERLPTADDARLDGLSLPQLLSS
jgi:hypothetical protein